MPTRRAVLETGLSVAALAAFPSIAGAQVQAPPSTGPAPATAPTTDNEPPQSPERRVGYAIVGLGAYATEQIIPSFGESSRSRLAAVVSGDRAKAREYADRYGLPPSAAYTYDDIAKLKDDKTVQAVYVITPNSLHLPYAEAAAKAGKHVLTEKPMEINEARCQAMIDACRAAGVKLMVGYRSLYEPFNEECIRLCRAGELGKIRTVTSEHGRTLDPAEKRDGWRQKIALAGGGALMDIGIYALSAAMYLTGEEPIEISAFETTDKSDPRFKEVEDRINWTMRFPSGALANLATGYSWSETKRYSVIGDGATLDLNPATDYYEHNLTITSKDGKREPKIDEQNQFARQLDHFSRAIQEGTAIRSPGEMGLRDVGLMMKIYESVRLGRPVKV